MEYPKIETLFNRFPKGHPHAFRVDESQVRLPEFENIKKWFITEKVDGTNVRIIYDPNGIDRFIPVVYKGRTEKAQLHPNLMKHLEETYTEEKLKNAFYKLEEKSYAVIFAEGYGPKIQKGGNYRSDISTRVFDVFIYDEENALGGWWLEPLDVGKIVDILEVEYVPILPISTMERAVEYVKEGSPSVVATAESGNIDYQKEGIVARTQPLLFNKKGDRIIWKLKTKDFKH